MKRLSLSARLALASVIGVVGVGVVGSLTTTAQAQTTCSSTTPVSVAPHELFSGADACANVAGNEVDTTGGTYDSGGDYTDTGAYTCLNGGCIDVGGGVSNFTGPHYSASGTNVTVGAGGTYDGIVDIRVQGTNFPVNEPTPVCVSAGTGGVAVVFTSCATGSPILWIPHPPQ